MYKITRFLFLRHWPAWNGLYYNGALVPNRSLVVAITKSRIVMITDALVALLRLRSGCVQRAGYVFDDLSPRMIIREW